MLKKRSVALFVAIFVMLFYFLQSVSLLTDTAMDFAGTKATVVEKVPEVITSLETADSNLITLTLVFAGVAILGAIVGFALKNHWCALASAVLFIASVVTFSIVIDYVYPISFFISIVLGLMFVIGGYVQQLKYALPKKDK